MRCCRSCSIGRVLPVMVCGLKNERGFYHAGLPVQREWQGVDNLKGSASMSGTIGAYHYCVSGFMVISNHLEGENHAQPVYVVTHSRHSCSLAGGGRRGQDRHHLPRRWRQKKGSSTLDPLMPGMHEICAKMVNKNHTPIGVERCIKVTAE